MTTGPTTRLAGIFLLCAAASSPAVASTVCTAVADAATGRVLKREGACDRRVTPASTFKIAISLMGYDAGFLTDEHLPALPFHEGYSAWDPSWRATTDPTAWIRNSVVWFSQQTTEWLGEGRFLRYVTGFQYGNEDVSGDPGKHNGLTQAWLGSSLQISPLEQVAFLTKVVRRQLPVSAKAVEMTSRITKVALLPDGWEIHGKTGTGFPFRPDGTEDTAHAYGWFVGWATKAGRTLVFARLIQDEKAQEPRAGLRARAAFLKEAPTLLDAL